MTNLNAPVECYPERLIQNMKDLSYTIQHHLLNRESILRPKQREAISETIRKMQEEKSRAIAMIMPTATGKMVIVSRMLAGLKADENPGEAAKKIVFVCDGIEGIKQARDKMLHYAGIQPGLFYGRKKDISKQITVTTFHSWQRDDFPIDPGTIDLVILDEAHMSISDQRISALKKYDNAVWLALTATPDYSDQRSVLLNYDLGYRLSLREAVENGLIAGFRNVLLHSDIDIDMRQLEKSRGADFNDRQLGKALNIEARNRIGAEYLLSGTHFDTGEPIRDLRGIVSCVDTIHAKDVAELVNAMYNKHYPGQAPKHGFIRWISGNSKDRDALLAWHREGSIKYLAFADLLNQNYDDHGISVCLNLRLSRSKVLSIQRAGRAERLDENNPNKIALIVDVYDNYNGKSKEGPVLYAAAIGEVSVISEESLQLAFIEKEKRNVEIKSNSLYLPAELREMAKQVEFRIETDESSILSIVSEIATDGVKDKTEEDYTWERLAALVGAEKRVIFRTFHNIKADWDNHNIDSDRYPMPPVKLEAVRKRGKKVQLSISKEQLPAYFQHYGPAGVARDKRPDDLTALDIRKMTGFGENKIAESFQAIAAEWDKYNQSYRECPPPPFVLTIVRDPNNKLSVAKSIHRSSFDQYIKIYFGGTVFEKRLDNHLSIAETAERTGISKPTLISIFRELGVQYEKYVAAPEENPMPPVIIYKTKKEGRKATYTISEDQLPLFLQHYYKPSEVIERSEDHLTVSELSKISGFSKNAIIQSIKKIRKSWERYKKTKSADDKPLVCILTIRLRGRVVAPAIEKRQYDIYFKEYLQEKICPLQDENDFDANEVSRLTGIDVNAIREKFNDIYRIQQEKGSSSKGNIALECKITRKRKDKMIPQLTITKSDFQKFIDSNFDGPILRTRSENDLTVTDIANRTGLSRTPIQNSMAKIESEWEKYRKNPSKNPKPKVIVSKVRDTNPTKSRTFAIPKDSWDYYFENYLSSKTGFQKTDEDLTLAEVMKLLDLPERAVYDAFKTMEKAWSLYEKNPSKFEHSPIKIKIIKAKRKPVRSVSRRDLPRMIEQYFPQKLAFCLANRKEIFPVAVEESVLQME